MTPEAQMALIAIIVPCVAAVGTMVTTIITYLLSAAQLRAQADEQKKQAAELAKTQAETDKKSDGKLDHITFLTNSTLTTANKRIDELEGIVRTLISNKPPNDQTKAIAAASVDVKDETPPAEPPAA